MKLLVPLMLLLSGGTYQGAIITSATECPTKFPEFEIPDALEEVCGPLAFWSEKDKEYFRDYRVKSDTKQFTLNCTSNYPVQIRVTLTKPYTNATFALHSNPTESKLSNGTIAKGHCYTASITFLEVNENLSGLYACESFLTYNGNLAVHPEYRPLGIFIYAYASKDLSLNGTMINRGKNITVKPEVGMGQKSNFSLYLPCTFNTPSLLKTEITYVNKGEQISFDMPAILCKDNKNLCMDFNSVSFGHKTAVIFQNGAQVSCSTNNSVNELDTVHLNILPSSDFKFEPAESEMILEVQKGEKYTFYCQSSKPVKLTTNYQHGHQISTNSFAYTEKPYYQAKLEMVIPDGDAIFYLEWNYLEDFNYINGRDRNRKNVPLNVSCTEEGSSNSVDTLKRHDWKYTLIFTAHPFEDIDDLNHNPLEYNRIVRQSHSPYFWICQTPSPKTMHVYFVPCSTITECQMKAPLLSDNDYLYDEWVTYYYHSVRFELEAGISGMVRCVGFQKDIMSYFYVGLDESGLHRSLSSIEYFETSTNPLVFLNASKIIVGQTVEANCTSPLMTLMSTSIFEFRLRNSTRTDFIPIEYILEQKSTTKNEHNIIFAKIFIPTIEVIGIACTNLQFTSMSPLVWKNGILQENADNYNVRAKVETAFLNVSPRPSIHKTLPADKSGMIVGLTFAVLFLIGVVTTVHFFLRFRAQKKLLEKLSDEEIESYRNGCPELISENENGNSNAQHLPFLPKFEIDPATLEIDFKKKLGAGEFGIVYKGCLKLNEVVPVAVKTLKPGASGAHLRSAMAELKVMIFIGQHENIVKIIGACTNDLENEQLLVVMEFCENQSLLDHLRNNSQFFFNQVQKGVYYPDLLEDGSYACFVKTSDLIRWSFEIANGMQYISSLKVIHGDLAARNVLLDKKFAAKISDFGLSRKLYELPAYIRKKAVPLPWGWCALETLLQQKFSLATDVWSFGVTLWEMFSLGECPYPGMEYGNQFLTMLTNNFRMAMPTYSSCEIYNIMMECWNKEPTKRPIFGELRERLQVMNSLAHATDDIEERFSSKQTPFPDSKELQMRISIDTNCQGNPTKHSRYYNQFSLQNVPV